MEKIGLVFKESLRTRLKEYLKESQGVLVVKYSKLSALDLSTLRQRLKESKATLFMARNAVTLRALKDEGIESINRHIEGSCGLIFIKEEPVNICRVLYTFSREHEQLKVEGGFFGDKVLENKDVEALSKLPTKEVLRAQLVVTLNSPIFGLACVLKQLLRKFVYCLGQVKNKKENK